MTPPTRAPGAKPTDPARLRRLLIRVGGLSPEQARIAARRAVLAGRAPLAWGRSDAPDGTLSPGAST